MRSRVLQWCVHINGEKKNFSSQAKYHTNISYYHSSKCDLDKNDRSNIIDQIPSNKAKVYCHHRRRRRRRRCCC